MNNLNNLNTYEVEENKDRLLNNIKMICFSFLADSENINHVKTRQLKNYLSYINSEYEEITSLKDSLKIQHYSRPYFEIFSNLDSMIVSPNLLSKTEKMMFTELIKDINYLEDSLSFCYGVISKAIEERCRK